MAALFPVLWNCLRPSPDDFLWAESQGLVCEGGGDPGAWFLLVPGLGVWMRRGQMKSLDDAGGTNSWFPG